MTQDMTKLNCLCCLPRVDVVDGHVPSIGMAAFIMGRQQVFGAISQMLTSLDEIWQGSVVAFHLPCSSDIEKFAEFNGEIIFKIRPKMVEVSPENWGPRHIQVYEKHCNAPKLQSYTAGLCDLSAI